MMNIRMNPINLSMSDKKEERLPLEWYKENINLIHFAISQYGFVPNYKHSPKYSYGQNAWHTLENPQTGENFIFSLKLQPGDSKPHYYYINTSGGVSDPSFGNNKYDMGSIFDFVMFREGLDLGKIIGKLKYYVSDIEPKLSKDELYNVQDLRPSNRVPSGQDIYKFFNVKPLDKKDPPEEIVHFLELRSIPLEILSNPKFCNNLYYRTYINHFDQKVTDLCFPITSPAGETGFFAINQMFYKDRSFKQILGFKQDGLWFSGFDKTRPIDKIIISESPIDSISHYYLHPEDSSKNILFAATIGSISSPQCKTLEIIIDKHKPEVIVPACDQDAAGQKFNLFLTSQTKYLQDGLKFMDVQFHSNKSHQATVQINYNTGTFENNILIASQIKEWITGKMALNSDKEESQLHKIECHILPINDAKGSISFDFFSLSRNWNIMTDLIAEFKLKNAITIQQSLPINKDFNKDLQSIETSYKAERTEFYETNNKPLEITFKQFIQKSYPDKELMTKTILDHNEKIDEKNINAIYEDAKLKHNDLLVKLNDNSPSSNRLLQK